MSMLPIVKIPLLFGAALTNHISYTPPNPPPKDGEAMKHESVWEKIFIAVVPAITGYFKLIGWVVLVGETAAILAPRYPSLATSRTVLDALGSMGLPPSPAIGITTPFLVGCGLSYGGALIRTQCYRALGRFFTFELAMKEGHRLCTSGPYSVVRHPSYTGLLMNVAALGIWTLSRGSWVYESGWLSTPVGRGWSWMFFALSVYGAGSLLLRTKVEDDALRSEFGEEWRRWAAKVPCRLLPGIY